MKNLQKAVSILLAAALLCTGALPVFADDVQTEDATQTEVTQTAAVKSNPGVSKDETVYVVLNTDGTVKTQTVSEHLHADAGVGTVQDVSTLVDITNTESDAAFTQQGTSLSWDSADTDVYYSGNTEAKLPVSVSVSYTLDGVQATPEQLAGKSGHLYITINMINNEMGEAEIDGETRTVCTPFITVVGTLLDTDHFTAVSAEHGTVQTDGSNQVVGFVCLPGVRACVGDLLSGELSKANDYLLDTVTIEANVTDFTVPSLMFACAADADALKNVDGLGSLGDMSADMDKLTDATNSLIDGAKQLATGAKQLNDGAVTLKTGVDTLTAGANTLSSGAGDLVNGANSLDGYMQQLAANNDSLNGGANQIFTSILATATTQLRTQLDGTGIEVPDLTADNYADVLNSIGGGVYQQVHDAVDAAVRATVTTTVKRTVAARVAVTLAYAAQGAPAPEGDAMDAAVAAMLDDTAQVAVLDAAIAGTDMTDTLTQYVQAALAEQADTINSTIEATVAAQWADPNSEANQNLQAQLAGHGADELTALQTQLDQVKSFVSGLANYTGTVAQLQQQGSAPLVDGAQKVANAAQTLAGGAQQLAGGAATLTSGTGTLNDGASALYQGVVKFDSEGISKLTGSNELANLGTLQAVATEMQNRLNAYTGYAGAPEGTNNTVKFIMKTEVPTSTQTEATNMDAGDAQAATVPEEKTSFWDRVLNLFGIGA